MPPDVEVYGANAQQLLPVGDGPLPPDLAWLAWRSPQPDQPNQLNQLDQLASGEEYRALWALRQRRDQELPHAGLALLLSAPDDSPQQAGLIQMAWGWVTPLFALTQLHPLARSTKAVRPYVLPPARYQDQAYRLQVRQSKQLHDSTYKLMARPGTCLRMVYRGVGLTSRPAVSTWSGSTGAGRLVIRHGWPDFAQLDAAGRDDAGAWWVPTVAAPPRVWRVVGRFCAAQRRRKLSHRRRSFAVLVP